MPTVEANNIVCKHRLTDGVFYVDAGPFLETSEEVSSATVTTQDDNLTLGTPDVLTSDTTVSGITIEANTGISISISGGTVGTHMLEFLFTFSTGRTEGLNCELEIPGLPVYLKRGSKQTVDFSVVPAVSMSDVLLGIKDSTGRSFLKITGTKNSSTDLTFSITASDSLKFIEGEHFYDIFEVAGYTTATGAYTDANLVVSGPAIIEPLYLRLENT